MALHSFRKIVFLVPFKEAGLERDVKCQQGKDEAVNKIYYEI